MTKTNNFDNSIIIEYKTLKEKERQLIRDKIENWILLAELEFDIPYSSNTSFWRKIFEKRKLRTIEVDKKSDIARGKILELETLLNIPKNI